MQLKLIIFVFGTLCSGGLVSAGMKEDIGGIRAILCEKDLDFIGNKLVACFQNVSLPLYTEAFNNCCPEARALNGTEERRDWFCASDTEKLVKCNECTENSVNNSGKKEAFEEEIKPLIICIADSFQSKETSSPTDF